MSYRSDIKLCAILLAVCLLMTGCGKENSSASVSNYQEIPVENTISQIQVVKDGTVNSAQSDAAYDSSYVDNDETDNSESLEGSDIADGSAGENDVDSDAGAEGDAADSDDSAVGINANTADSTSVSPASVEYVSLDPSWTYANYSAIHTGNAVLYRAAADRKNIVIGVNAGHGTKGGTSVKTYCHPDMTAKVTGGTTASGSTMSSAVSSGMTFSDGTSEASVTLKEAQILRDKLLSCGYDVLMLRDAADVQLDNIARSVICNNKANCHIAIHWDGDGLGYDKGCFYISTPDGIKAMEPVASTYTSSEALGQALISGLSSAGCKIYSKGSMAIDLTQTSFSTVPSVDIELGNAASCHDDATLSTLADGIVAGIKSFYP